MRQTTTALLGALFLCATGAAQAAPVNGDGFITSDVIYGSGNANGGFTGATFGNLELALRGKLRYDENGDPQDVYNYDGDRTYRFDPTGKDVPANRAVFNFDYAINTDVSDTDDTPDNFITDYIFELTADTDPSGNDNGTINILPLILDNSYGFNSTPNGGGDENNSLALTRNVAQNSRNTGFGVPPGSPALGIGTFTYTLSAFERTGFLGFERGDLIGSTSIDVIVGPIAPVPLPAALPMLLAGLGGFAALRRRKRAA